VNAKGCPSCINTTPRPQPKRPHSRENVLVKSSTAKTRVVHMASFKVEKAYSAASFQTKAFFSSSEVKGDANFPKFFTTFL